MSLLIPCILLLVISGAVCGTEVMNGTLGNFIVLNESVPEPGLLLQWYFKGIAIAAYSPPAAPACNPNYTGRCQMYDNGTLRLDNLTSTDDGIYRFVALKLPFSTVIKEAYYELRVYPILNPPVISSNVTSINLMGGTYVSLHCNASDQNVTTYTFNLDGKNICSKPHVTCQDSNLYLQPITGSDSGNYTCTIQNPVSSNTSQNSVQLHVIDPVSDVNLTSNITGLVWPGLDSVSLTCLARGTNVSYIWNLQGELLPKVPQYNLTENNRVLIISPVSDKDNGTFTCTAINEINNKTSNGISFTLASRVSAVKLSSNTSESYIWVGEDSVSLNCSADGSNVTFLWKLNGEPLPPGSQYHISEDYSPPHSNLLISPVSKSDTGPFTCNASNRLGNKTSNALNFSLAWKPEKKIDCSAVKNGQNITLGCSWSGGQPKANVSLNFNGKTENGQTDSVTSQVSIDEAQGKDLTCHGDQLGRKSQCTLRIDVVSPKDGLSSGAIAGIVIGVLAGVALIGIVVFFIVKKKKRSGDNKRLNDPDEQQGATVTYATVQKKNGGVAETSLTNNQEEDDVKYAVLKFPNNNSTMATVPSPVETEYSTVKTSIRQ